MTTDWLTNGGNKFPKDFSELEVASGSAFKNAANGEFYLKNSILEKDKVGDPRWIK